MFSSLTKFSLLVSPLPSPVGLKQVVYELILEHSYSYNILDFNNCFTVTIFKAPPNSEILIPDRDFPSLLPQQAYTYNNGYKIHIYINCILYDSFLYA